MLVALALAVAAQAAAEDANLIADGYFSYAGQAAAWQQLWYPVVVGGAAWCDVDAGGAPAGQGSGSLEVAVAPIGQSFRAFTCVPVVAGATYRLAGDVLVTEVADGGRAELGVQLMRTDNCWGSAAFLPPDPLVVDQASAGWQQVEGSFTAPDGARSALVTATVLHDQAASGPDMVASFDNLGLWGEAPDDRVPELYVGGSDGFGERKGRFAVTATWRAADGRSGPAFPFEMTADSGGLWFFSPANVELVVKVLDACRGGLGDSYWVFVAGLTDLAVDVRVRDLENGYERTYSSPGGVPFAAVTDTLAFPCEPTLP